ncbi:MAG TPA: hypothetical protein VEN81_05650, partial [Planctomycetota bacterium]|nr:hypothetical protein [Planctomycetota bacterium]
MGAIDMQLSVPGPSALPPPDLDRPVVVCVDDDPMTLEGIRRHLRNEPYDLILAHSPKEAETLLGDRPVGLLILAPKRPGKPAADFQ